MLKIYSYDVDNNLFVEHSQNGLFTNPIQTVHNGTLGEIVEKQLFLKSDDAGFYYSNLTLQALPLSKTAVDDINYPEAFVNFKIIVQNGQPTETQWKSTASGSLVVFADIGSVGNPDLSYKPFWIQVSIPSGVRVQNINDISVNVAGEESPV
jgi:hypothetical protein